MTSAENKVAHSTDILIFKVYGEYVNVYLYVQAKFYIFKGETETCLLRGSPWLKAKAHWMKRWFP